MENSLIDKSIIIISILAVVVMTVVIMTGTLLMIKWNTKSSSFEEGIRATIKVIEKLNVLETVTILTIIAAVLLLQLTGLEISDGILSLFSAIAGYVLGSIGNKSMKSPE